MSKQVTVHDRAVVRAGGRESSRHEGMRHRLAAAVRAGGGPEGKIIERLEGRWMMSTSIFDAPAPIETEVHPYAVAVGDFNGDRKIDLVTANKGGGGTVSVLLGSGDGTFGTKLNSAVGETPVSVSVGDFNGDGKADLVAANSSSGTVSVLLGNGNGTFAAKQDYAVGVGTLSVTVCDLDGDGKDDVVTTRRINSFFPVFKVSVFIAGESGTFPAKVDYVVGGNPSSVAVGDFDGDGKTDLVVANNDSYSADGTPLRNVGTVSVLLGKGGGTFATTVDYEVGANPWSVSVGDFNGDGKPDLATANKGGGGTVSVLLGSGNGTFATKVDYAVGANPTSMSVGDFNGDGKGDLVTANNQDSSLSVLLGNGDGTFATKTNYALGAQPQSVTVSDVNGDGKADLLVVAPLDTAVVTLLRGNGDGTFGSKYYFDAGSSRYPYSVTVGDFNMDGKLDLAAANAGFDYAVSVLLGKGDGTFAPKVEYALRSEPGDIVVADFNGDGVADLMVNKVKVDADYSLDVLLSNGDGTFAMKVNRSVPNGPRLVVGDFDGDGKADLVTRADVGFYVSLGRGDGTFAQEVGYLLEVDPVAVGDFNGDGKVDLAANNPSDEGPVSVLLGNGDGTFTVNIDTATSGRIKTVADFNRDGKDDLLITRPFDQSVSGVTVLLGKGDGTFAMKVDATTKLIPYDVAAGDFNSDGKVDVVIINPVDLAMSVLLGKGDGSFSTEVEYALVKGPRSVAVGDFNGDGKPDVTVDSSKSVQVLLNVFDNVAPTAKLTSIAPNTKVAEIMLSWSGSDNAGGSGIASYTVYVSENGGAFQAVPSLTNVAATTGNFTGVNGSTYEFYVVATDYAGNVQVKTAADTSTQIDVDVVAPTASMTAVPAVVNAATLALSWSGSDNGGGSGISSYTLYVSDNGGAFAAVPHLTNVNTTAGNFTGVNGHTYEFYVTARDKAGNVQMKTIAETMTVIDAPLLVEAGNGGAASPDFALSRVPTLKLPRAVAGAVVGGGAVRGTAMLTNLGAAIRGGPVTVNVYLSNDVTLSGIDNRVKTVVTRPVKLRRKGTFPVPFAFTLPTDVSDQRFVIVSVDGGAVTESSTLNNASTSAGFMVMRPVTNLMAVMVKAKQAKPGKVSTASVTVKNAGNTAFNGTVSIGLSFAATGGASEGGDFGTTAALLKLQPGKSATLSVKYKPLPVLAGNSGTLTASLNFSKMIGDSDFSDNTASVPLAIAVK